MISKFVIQILLLVWLVVSPAPRLIKDANSPRVYFILDGRKSWIQTPQSFERMVSSWSAITLIQDSDIYPNGDAIDNDSQLMRGKDSTKVYLALYGVKRWITTPGVFESLGLDWGKVAVVDHWVLQLFREGLPIN